jgi:hypothetical protein
MNQERQGVESREHGAKLVLMRKPVRRVEAVQVVREATTGCVVSIVPMIAVKAKVLMLPRVWAVGETLAAEPVEVPEDEPEPPEPGAWEPGIGEAVDSSHEGDVLVAESPDSTAEPMNELAFYRRYTEAMLRRYVRLSMAAGRVPSLLGRELFRGNVTSYKVQSFEDVVVFCFDIEHLLGRLRPIDQKLIKRIAVQEHTQGETASMLRISLRHCIRMYSEAVDRLTKMLLEAKMLEPQIVVNRAEAWSSL